MIAVLRQVAGPGAGREAEVATGRPLTVGRDPACGFLLEHATVSRTHGRFSCEDGLLTISRLGATNPVWVNGSPVDRHTLGLWDLVVIGPFALRVERLGDGRPASVPEHIDAERSLLASLLEVQRLLAGDAEDVLPRCLRTLLNALPATTLALFERDGDGHPVQTHLAGHRGDSGRGMSAVFANKVIEAGRPQLLEERRSDADWTATLVAQAVRTILGVPILVDGRITGALLCDNRERPGALDATHLRILEAVAQSLAYVIQRQRLQKLQQERLIRAAELRAARQVQCFLVADGDPGEVAPGRWATLYEPALELAGDFHAVARHPGSATWLIADVCGKGMPAALVTAMLKAAFRRYAADDLAPDELLRRLHRDLAGSLPPAMFFTACALRVAADGSFGVAGAGHPPALLLRADGSDETFAASPGLLGCSLPEVGEPQITPATGRLGHGDRLVLLTDGVTEAHDAGRRMFEEAGALRAMRTAPAGDPHATAQALLAAVRAHHPGPPEDDITAVVCCW